MIKLTSIFGALALLGTASALVASEVADRAWTIGPIIKGKNYSLGMDPDPVYTSEGIAIDFPTMPSSHVHYVTFDPGKLEGKTEIVMRYRIEAERGTRFIPQESPDLPAMLSLYFQRRGDRWNAKGAYAYYRWYAPQHSMVKLEPGEFEVRVKLRDPQWISVWGHEVGDKARYRDRAMLDVERVGFVLGSNSARGHGVYATKPARMTVTHFEIR